MPNIIVSTITPSNRPYAGPLCARVSIVPGTLYTSRRAAARDCAKLNRLSPGGFHTQPLREQTAWEEEQRAVNQSVMGELRWEYLLHGRTLSPEARAAYVRGVAGIPAAQAVAA